MTVGLGATLARSAPRLPPSGRSFARRTPPPLVARCHLDLGKLARRMGQQPRAQEHLTTETTLLREMGMRFWLEQVEAELRN